MAFNQDVSWDHGQHVNYNGMGDPLAIIYNEGTWQLSKVSALRGLQTAPARLKAYASRVRHALCGAAPASAAAYSVAFQQLLHLRQSEDHAPAIMITVTSSLEKKSKICYTAILLSWGSRESLDEGIYLPYMLEKGEPKISNSVRTTLQTLFDCNIWKFTFTQQQLLQFVFELVEMSGCRSSESFCLTYNSPAPDLKENISFTFDVEDIFLMWNSIKDESGQRAEKTAAVYRVLQNQLFTSVGVDVAPLALAAVSCGRATLRRDGAARLRSAAAARCLLQLLPRL